jgi:hypothetical protein
VPNPVSRLGILSGGHLIGEKLAVWISCSDKAPSVFAFLGKAEAEVGTVEDAIHRPPVNGASGTDRELRVVPAAA